MPLPGFCTRADAPADLFTVARVLQRHVRPGAVISHTTALELLGVPLPRERCWANGEPLHCRATQERYRSRTNRIIAHAPRSSPHLRWRGIDVVHPLVALQDCAQSLIPDDLVVCIDALAGTKAGVAIPLAELMALSLGLRGRGADAIRDAAQAAAENVWSPMETRARLLLTRRGYPPPIANLRVDDPDTDWHGYIDLAYPQWKIAIEYDSDEHRVHKARWQKDLHKNEVLHLLGWSVLRISVADLANPEQFLRRLNAAITRSDTAFELPDAVISRADAA